MSTTHLCYTKSVRPGMSVSTLMSSWAWGWIGVGMLRWCHIESWYEYSNLEEKKKRDKFALGAIIWSYNETEDKMTSNIIKDRREVEV